MIEPTIDNVGGAILLAVLIGALVRNRGWNGPLILLGSGLLVGLLPIGPSAAPDPELVLVLVLAPLVFGEALSSSIVDIRRSISPVAWLAVGLVIISAAAAGAVAAWVVPGLPVAAALCLGSVLGPTDAVAVASTTKGAGLPRRLVEVLEGESLLNDGTSLTLLRVCSAAAAAGAVTVGEVAGLLVVSVAAGVAVGLCAGWLLAVAARRIQDVTVVNGLLLVAPFPVYGGAEALGGSGILAVVAAALLFAHNTSSAVGYTGRLLGAGLWRSVTFLLQSAAFFLVGIDLPAELIGLSDDETRLLALLVPCMLAVLIGVRVVFVFVMESLNGQRRSHPRSWVVLGWAGTRGPISVLAALTLPLTLTDGSPFPYRSLLICTTFCVVIASLLLSLSIPRVVRAAALAPDDDKRVSRRVRLALARASLNRLEEIELAAERTDRPIPEDVLDPLRSAAELRLDASSRAVETGSSRPVRTHTRVRSVVAAEMAHAEQRELLRLRDEEGLPDTLMRQFQLDIDARLRAIETLPQ